MQSKKSVASCKSFNELPKLLGQSRIHFLSFFLSFFFCPNWHFQRNLRGIFFFKHIYLLCSISILNIYLEYVNHASKINSRKRYKYALKSPATIAGLGFTEL